MLVCDWGLGKVPADPWEERDAPAAALPPAHDNMTLVGEIKGSPGYMAPEQVLPGGRKDKRTDIYALGCILHLILTGKPPFTGTSDKVIDATSRGNIPPPRLRYPHRDIPESLEAVVMKATARRPEARYESALQLRDEVRNYLGGYATRAEQPGFFREARLFLARNRAPSVVAALAFAVLTVLTVLFVQRLGHQRRATSEERQRASRLESRADSLESLYESERAQSAESRANLARDLADSANSLKNLGIFESPAKAVKEASQLAATALALDPGCEQARIEKFSLACIMLDFEEALVDVPAADGHQFADYVRFAEAFPDFRFGDRLRPGVRQLVAFFRRARGINPDRAPLMERILSYDLAVRSDPEPYDQALIALLQYLNGGDEHLICVHHPGDASFFLWSDRDVQLLVSESQGGSGRCLLRYLAPRSLKLEVAGRLRLSDLELLPVESLDLAGCPNLVVDRPVNLPLVREIRVRAGQPTPRRLRQLVRSGGLPRFIEVPRPD